MKEAEGAARRGVTAAGGVREARDGKGIRPDLLIREHSGCGGGRKEAVKEVGPVHGLFGAKSMVFCASNYGEKTVWSARGDGKTWAERVADRCVRQRMKEVEELDTKFFAACWGRGRVTRAAAATG